MRRSILLWICSFAAMAASGQVYKMDDIWMSAEQFLKCKRDIVTGEGHRFILYDIKYYGEGITNPFMSVYFDGTADEFAMFISGIKSLLDKYKNEDSVMTEIAGRKIYRTRMGLLKGVYIFEDDGRHFGGYRDRDIETIDKNFRAYCHRNGLLN